MLKLCLLLLGLVAALAVFASAENNEEASLTDGIVSSRVARSAEAEAGRKKRKNLKRKRVQKKGSKKAKTALNKAQKKLKIRENKARKKIGKRKRAKRKMKKIEKRKSKRRNVRKNKKNDQKQGRKRQSGRCFDDVVQSMKEYKKATNHLRMAKRVSSWTDTMAKKKAKAATVFQETLEALNSSCVDSEDVATTAALATLTNCSASAAAACDSTSLNISTLESCTTTLMTQIDAFDVGGQLKLHLFLHS